MFEIYNHGVCPARQGLVELRAPVGGNKKKRAHVPVLVGFLIYPKYRSGARFWRRNCRGLVGFEPPVTSRTSSGTFTAGAATTAAASDTHDEPHQNDLRPGQSPGLFYFGRIRMKACR